MARDETGKFLPGESGNPAGYRPPPNGPGRTLALEALDAMLSRPRNRAILIRALEDAFRKEPLEFFLTVVKPLLKTALLPKTKEAIPAAWPTLTGEDQDEDDPEPAAAEG